MRPLLAVLPLLAAVLVGDLPEADARPEFARRESKACGYCHINPRGGGPRNQRGLLYARHEFSFPAGKTSLADFKNEKQRAQMARVRQLLEIDHTKAAFSSLRKLERSVKSANEKKAVADALHALDVRGSEILGQARLQLRKPDEEAEGVELIVVLATEFKGLDVHQDAVSDLKELKKEKRLRSRIKKEEREAKARLLWLDALVARLDKKEDKAQKLFKKIVKSYPKTRVAKLARKQVKPEEEPG